MAKKKFTVKASQQKSVKSATRKPLRKQAIKASADDKFADVLKNVKYHVSFNKGADLVFDNNAISSNKRDIGQLLDKYKVNDVVVDVYRDRTSKRDLQRMQDLGFDVQEEFLGNAESDFGVPPHDFYHMVRNKKPIKSSTKRRAVKASDVDADRPNSAPNSWKSSQRMAYKVTEDQTKGERTFPTSIDDVYKVLGEMQGTWTNPTTGWTGDCEIYERDLDDGSYIFSLVFGGNELEPDDILYDPNGFNYYSNKPKFTIYPHSGAPTFADSIEDFKRKLKKEYSYLRKVDDVNSACGKKKTVKASASAKRRASKRNINAETNAEYWERVRNAGINPYWERIDEPVVQFDPELLKEARQMFYKVYVDNLSDDGTQYVGSETATKGVRMRVFVTDWDYETEEVFRSNEELEAFIKQYKADYDQDKDVDTGLDDWQYHTDIGSATVVNATINSETDTHVLAEIDEYIQNNYPIYVAAEDCYYIDDHDWGVEIYADRNMVDTDFSYFLNEQNAYLYVRLSEAGVIGGARTNSVVSGEDFAFSLFEAQDEWRAPTITMNKQILKQLGDDGSVQAELSAQINAYKAQFIDALQDLNIRIVPFLESYDRELGIKASTEEYVGVDDMDYITGDDESTDLGFGFTSDGEPITESMVEELERIAREILEKSEVAKYDEYADLHNFNYWATSPYVQESFDITFTPEFTSDEMWSNKFVSGNLIDWDTSATYKIYINVKVKTGEVVDIDVNDVDMRNSYAVDSYLNRIDIDAIKSWVGRLVAPVAMKIYNGTTNI